MLPGVLVHDFSRKILRVVYVALLLNLSKKVLLVYMAGNPDAQFYKISFSLACFADP
jgi:hypothetical protein